MRATSVFPMWHPLGGYLVVVALVAIALLLLRDTEALRTVWLVGVLGLALVALVLTLTATIIAGLVLGVIVLGWATKRLRFVLTWMVLGGGALLMAFYPIVAERVDAQSTATAATPTAGDSILPQTILYRLVIWSEQYLPALRGMWLTGYGPADPPGISWGHTESGYLTLSCAAACCSCSPRSSSSTCRGAPRVRPSRASRSAPTPPSRPRSWCSP